ncbi:hypothetical protein BJ508DRAFT_313691 [Ascobolus immersus RN42]|uniref:Uncharacterized protein n=1 Tax=Ascobolus immersus RN42 TaxID=1160509 RepID=A0A3N4HHY4_ASCIM|nr:hypothetical protein BJ508DRAFT_313691 [Ascobolus immersus RN42]
MKRMTLPPSTTQEDPNFVAPKMSKNRIYKYNKDGTPKKSKIAPNPASSLRRAQPEHSIPDLIDEIQHHTTEKILQRLMDETANELSGLTLWQTAPGTEPKFPTQQTPSLPAIDEATAFASLTTLENGLPTHTLHELKTALTTITTASHTTLLATCHAHQLLVCDPLQAWPQIIQLQDLVFHYHTIERVWGTGHVTRLPAGNTEGEDEYRRMTRLGVGVQKLRFWVLAEMDYIVRGLDMEVVGKVVRAWEQEVREEEFGVEHMEGREWVNW